MRPISCKISEDAHKVIRRLRIESRLTTGAIIQLALVRLAKEVLEPVKLAAVGEAEPELSQADLEAL